MPRMVEARIARMRALRPPRHGLCAQTTWRACGGDGTGLDFLAPLRVPDATTATGRIRQAGHLHDDPASSSPRGAIMCWTGGSHGYGHLALSLGVVDGVHRCLSVDAMGKPMADIPTRWIARNWSNLRWAGWSTWYGVELPAPYPGRPLRLGSKGGAVREVQRRLRLPITGTYGERTLVAVQAFQRPRPLLWPADGAAGPKTYAALGRIK